MNNRYAVLLITALGCAGSTAPLGNVEQLIQPFPLPEANWAAFEKREGNVRHIRWAPTDGTSSLVLSISSDVEVLLPDYLRFDAKLRVKLCRRDDSTAFEEIPRHGYPAVLWYSRCTFWNGKRQFVLQQAIAGEHTFYLFKRFWTEEPSDAQRELWVDYLRRVIVCNPTRSTAPCPEGFKPVESPAN